MSMEAEPCAKRIEEGYKNFKDNELSNYINSGQQDKDLKDYENKIKKKNEEEAKKKLEEQNKKSEYKDPSSISGMLAENKNLCPICKHINCGCKYHHPDIIEPEKEPEVTADEIQKMLEDLQDDLTSDDKNKRDEAIKKLEDYCNSFPPIESNFATTFAAEMDKEFQKASGQGGNILITANPMANIWRFNLSSNFIINALIISMAVSAYFVVAIIPMLVVQPSKGGVVTVVSNNAPSIILPLFLDIIMISIRGNKSNFVEICAVVIKHVSTITWVITEVVGNTPITYPSTIS